MSHRDHHPDPVSGCFGCKVSGLGFQGLQSDAGGRRSDPTKVDTVVADEGPSRGRVVGKQRVHWDGRQDAKVYAPTAQYKGKVAEVR